MRTLDIITEVYKEMVFSNLDIKTGDKVVVENESREVTDIIKNVEGNPVIIWATRRSCGACPPSVWREWRSGIPAYTRSSNDGKGK